MFAERGIKKHVKKLFSLSEKRDSLSFQENRSVTCIDDMNHGKIETNRMSNQYLITDRGFGRNFCWYVIVTGVVVILPFYVSRTLHDFGTQVWNIINDAMMDMAHYFAFWSLLGLLSSSCCAVQLILNALSLGCAGFNTALGPSRPMFMCFTFYAQVASWSVAYNRPWIWSQTFIGTIISVTLCFLPEVLATRVPDNTSIQGSNVQEENAVADSTMHTMGGTAEKSRTLQFGVKMACSACASTVSKVLDSIGDIKNHKILAEDGVVVVQLRQIHDDVVYDNTDVQQIRENIKMKLEDAGFLAESLIM